MASIFRFVMFLVAKVEQGGQPMRGDKDDVAAVSAVSTIRSASGHEHFPAETARTVSASSGFYHDSNFVDKHEVPFRGQSPSDMEG